MDTIVNKLELKTPNPEHFKSIAENMLCHYGILKYENGAKVFYRFAEVEFYFYDTNQYKNEICTINRDTLAGEWFFHRFGMDIAFETKKNGNELTSFGGILIRGLEKLDDQGNTRYLYGGPIVCSQELLNHATSLPKLVELPQSLVKNCTIGQSKRVLGESAYKPEENTGEWRFFAKGLDWKNAKRPIIKEHTQNKRVIVLLEEAVIPYPPRGKNFEV